MVHRQVSGARKAAYYIGGLISVVGLLLFASIFFTMISNSDDLHDRSQNMMFRAFGGMGLIVVGGIIRNLGARGLAGSGAVLDPQQARRDLEPYSRMSGGMLKDGLDEAGIDISGERDRDPERVVVIKCRECGFLNEEDSKFCQECGEQM